MRAPPDFDGSTAEMLIACRSQIAAMRDPPA
jgi:hypothetical protein